MNFQMLQLENGFAFIVRTIWLIAVVGYMGLNGISGIFVREKMAIGGKISKFERLRKAEMSVQMNIKWQAVIRCGWFYR